MISTLVQHKQKHTATSFLHTLITPGKSINAGPHTLASVAKLNLAHVATSVAQQATAIHHVIRATHHVIRATHHAIQAVIAVTTIARSLPSRNGVSGLKVDSPLINC